MAGCRLIWIPLLLTCVFETSDNRHVQQDVNRVISRTGNPTIDDILSKINLPVGIDPKNVNVTSITIRTCTGMKEQLEQLTTNLQEKTLQNTKLDVEAFGLRGEVRMLKLQLDTCSSTASAITGSYQTQLLNKMKQLLETDDSDTFLILKITALTRAVNALEKKVKHAANATETVDIQVLQKELQQKTNELNSKTQQFERSHPNAALILQITSLQSQIWDLEQEQSRRGETNLHPNRRILALQAQLDGKIRELQGKGDTHAAMMKLISVHSKITVIQKHITVRIAESRKNAADYQRQWRQKVELLKKKILLLNRDEDNSELTKEIFELQIQVQHFRSLMMNAKKETDSQLKELRFILEEEKKQQENLQKYLEEADFAQAQLIIKIISIMKEVRDLDGNDEQQQTTSTSQATTLQTLLEAKQREFAKAQEEINELQRKLKSKTGECSGLEERYEQAKTEFEQTIAELNRTGESKAALILNVINLHNDLKTLRGLISTTKDPDRNSELQRQLEEKLREVNSKTEDIERLIANPKIILTIIELQNQVWDLQKKAVNGTTGGRAEELQNRVDELISDIDDKGNDNTKQLLKIITLQSQVEWLQKQLSDLQKLQTNQVTQLTNELTTKNDELQKSVNELNEKNRTSARLITDLHNQLRNLEKEKDDDSATSSLTITQLREKLKAKMAEQSLDRAEVKDLQTKLQAEEKEHATAQAEVKELQSKLKSKTGECSGLEERYEQAKTEFEQTIAELNRTGESKAALILNVINMLDGLKTLEDLISTTKDPDRLSELQRQLEEKQDELNSKTEDIERLIANPKIILTIIELQNQIWDLQKKAVNGTTGGRAEELQKRVDELISDIDDKGNDNTKQLLKIITLQSQVEWLQKQLSDLQKLQTNQVTQLTNELTTKNDELQKSVNELNEKNRTSGRLILTVTDLHNQLRNLEKEKDDDSATSSLTITQLREKLKAKMAEQSRDRAEVKDLQTKLQAEEKEHATAQAEVKELQSKLKSKTGECSGLEERYEQAKTEFEQTIAELNRTGESKAALILNVINLHNDLKTLRGLISTTKDPDRNSELQRQLEEKLREVNSKTEDIERLIPNPKIILTIIELQNQIWDLQKKAVNGTTGGRAEELQNRVDELISDIDDKGNDNTKQLLKIITLQSQVEWLQKQLSDLQTLQTTQVTQLKNDLTTKKDQLQKSIDELNEKNQANAKLILTVTDLHNQLRKLENEKNNEDQKTSAAITKLTEQLKAQVEEHSRDHAEIRALQDKLNQTEAQCSNFEQHLTDLQNDLDTKIKELESRSESVTSLALQVSTLTLQVEELKRQQQNTESESKIKELQKIIDEKNNKLTKLTEDLKERSAQPQRLLQIIAIQTEIERLVTVPANDTNDAKITALQDHLNYLVEGIQDENDENTKLMFKIMTQQDEIARLEKQVKSQTDAGLEKINDLESELEDIRNQIKAKTLVLDSSDTRIANLSAQILELHKKIRPLEVEISDLKDANNERIEELQKRLDLTKKQQQDSELRLKDADQKNFNLIMELNDLKKRLKKAQKQASNIQVTEKNIDELKEQFQTQQRENKRLENTNKNLRDEVNELKMCCNENANNQCDDLQTQLQQSQEDAARLQQQLHEKDVKFNQLQQDLQDQTVENSKLQHEYSILEKQQQQTQDNADSLQQQLHEKDATLSQLQNDFDSLQNENNKHKDDIQGLQDKLSAADEKTIVPRKVTLDPNTAHPRVVLSADNTEMSTTEDIQNVLANPRRFDTILAVLGSTGFSSGRHYWQVSVAGKRCYHLGMASESVPRKGALAFIPSRGFWTIILDKQGRLKAADRRLALIQVQTLPLTLGILLDYKKGQISVYDAGARTHLHSFVGQRFTEKIYPFINFCVEDSENQQPIVLLSPGSTDWIQ